MSRARLYDEAMVDKVHVRLDSDDARAVEAIATREGRRSSDTVRQLVSLGLRVYPSFNSFAEIINTDLAGIARKILESQEAKSSSKKQASRNPKGSRVQTVQDAKSGHKRKHVVE